MLVLQNTPEAELELPGLTTHSEPLAWKVAKFDLTLLLAERRGPGGQPLGIEGGLEYSRDMFDEVTIEAIGGRFVQLLEQAVESPDIPLHRLEILSREERHTLLEEFNATGRPIPETTLPALFEQQVARTPEAVAVVFGDESMAYGELNCAGQPAGVLSDGPGCGAGENGRDLPGTVGGYGGGAAGHAQGWWGVPAAGSRLSCRRGRADGGGCRPDRGADDDRHQSVSAGDGRDRCCSIQEKHRTALAQARANDPTDADRTCPLHSQHPAYVIFTSGSTGAPKGAPTHITGLSIDCCGCRPRTNWMQRIGYCKRRRTASMFPRGSFSGHC